MHLRDFDFSLPTELIAQTPAARRDGSRLMIVDRRQGRIRHDGFAGVGNYLGAGDVLVVNDTKVIPARLRGRKAGTGGSVEVLLLHELGAGAWEVLLKPAAKAPPGTEVVFGEGKLRGRVGERAGEGAVILHFTPPDVLPAPAQAALAVEARADNPSVLALLVKIDDPAARAATTAERAFLHDLQGGCSLPAAALAAVNGGELVLDTAVYVEDGGVVRTHRRGPPAEAAALGREAAAETVARGVT